MRNGREKCKKENQCIYYCLNIILYLCKYNGIIIQKSRNGYKFRIIVMSGGKEFGRKQSYHNSNFCFILSYDACNWTYGIQKN